MQLKILSKRTVLLMIIFSGLILSVAFFLYFIPQSLGKSGSILPITNAAPFQKIINPNLFTNTTGLPAYLKIPSINVNTSIEYVGLTSSGAMDVPKKRANVAWFNLGVRPGESGSAVIAGHYGRRNGKGSVFDNLNKLRKGDKIYIKDDKGMTISFIVRKSRRYNPKADTSDVFGSNDGKSHLNFITCEGVWNKASKTYSKRLVVFTDKE